MGIYGDNSPRIARILWVSLLGWVLKGTYLEDHPSVSNFCLLVGFFGEKAQIFYTLGRSRYRVSWRIIPVSKWLVTQIGALKHDFLFSTGWFSGFHVTSSFFGGTLYLEALTIRWLVGHCYSVSTICSNQIKSLETTTKFMSLLYVLASWVRTEKNPQVISEKQRGTIQDTFNFYSLFVFFSPFAGWMFSLKQHHSNKTLTKPQVQTVKKNSFACDSFWHLRCHVSKNWGDTHIDPSKA